jgi:signal transduction histidine kinase
MIVIGKVVNRLAVLLVALAVISGLGYLDYITGVELSFSIFYLIPITLVALYRGTKLPSVLIASGFSALVWLVAELGGQGYSHLFYPIWNSVARLVMYTAIGVLLMYLKEKQKTLNEANRRLEAINEEKNRFIGIAAHDIRNSVCGIYSFSELLMSKYTKQFEPEDLEMLKLIQKISRNSLVLLRNTLDVSKIESGKVELDLKEQDYLLFLKDQVCLNQIVANAKNINIALRSAPGPLLLRFDSHYLTEVIDNLLLNAIRYSGESTEIVVAVSTAENGHVLTEVIDQGRGIAEEEQHKLFNYFQKTSTREIDGDQGAGLGLAIAKKIITLHSGSIGVKSSLNKGSNFYYLLPGNGVY